MTPIATRYTAAQAKKDAGVDLTVVVCTHNRSHLLERLLDSLAEAARPKSFTIEVLVIANACRDDTAELLRRSEPSLAASGLKLRWQEEPTPGKSYALNRALGRIRGEATVFVDDDQRVSSGFFDAVSRALAVNPKVNLFCGRLLPDWDGGEPLWVHAQGRYRIYPPPITTFEAGNEPRDITSAPFKPPGGNLLIRRPLLESLGDFSVALGPRGHDLGSGEDSEFLQRALNAGESLYYAPDILQYHHVDPERLRLGALMRLSYQRSLASMRIHGRPAPIPLYMWRKLAGYLASAIFSLSLRRTRYYLIRCAAVLGEMKGLGDPGMDAADR